MDEDSSVFKGDNSSLTTEYLENDFQSDLSDCSAEMSTTTPVSEMDMEVSVKLFAPYGNAEPRLQVCKVDTTRNEAFLNKKINHLQTKVESLERRLKESQDERKSVSQELKRTQHERDKTLKRAFTAEEKLKQTQIQLETVSNILAQAEKATKTLQKKVDELQKMRIEVLAEIEKGKAAPKKASNNNNNSSTDIVGLQCGLDRAKAQLKKKQEEFQTQTQKLQQASAKARDLEITLDERNKTIRDLEQKLERLEHLRADEKRDYNADRARMNALALKMQDAISQDTKKHEARMAEVHVKYLASCQARKLLVEESGELKRKLQDVLIQVGSALNFIIQSIDSRAG